MRHAAPLPSASLGRCLVSCFGDSRVAGTQCPPEKELPVGVLALLFCIRSVAVLPLLLRLLIGSLPGATIQACAAIVRG